MKTKKVDGNSYFPQGDFINQLKSDFPEVFTEDSKIDIDKLKATLGENADLGEKYGLSWKGKNEVFRTIQETTTKTLNPAKNESVDFDTSDNIFIEGDNLEALKILQRAYYGKVKMIYIDPPYNTGNEFVYNDKFSQNLEEYEVESGIKDSNGNVKETSVLYKNTRDSGHFHSNWLNMMYPRLYLARNLLRQDGVIFVSIDDNEVNNLRMIMNEIFGEENFIDCIIWKKRYGGGSKEKFLVTVHEYVLFYAKNIESIPDIEIALSEDSINRYYTKKDKHFKLRGPYRTHPLEAGRAMDDRENLIFPIIAPDDTEILPRRQWLWGKETVADALKFDELEFSKVGEGWIISTKQYLRDREGNIRSTKAFSLIDDVFTQHGTNEMIEIFGDARIFPYPKPVDFVKKLLEIGVEKDSLVLDFFAGSGTTAHAVMQLNAEDGGNRKWMMVQLPEETEENSEARKAGYKTIADIAKERIRRAAKKIKGGSNGQLPLQDHEQDLGFKVFKVDSTNFKVWDANVKDVEKLEKQMQEMFDTVRGDSTEEDLLFELMIKSGIEPTVEREKRRDKDLAYWKIGDGELIICLEDKMTKELFQTILTEKPQKIILLDRSFTEDQLKKNLTLQAEKGNIEMLVV